MIPLFSQRHTKEDMPARLFFCWGKNNEIREGTFLIGGGGGGPGYFRNFLQKKSWPSHFPDWINAWPFTNT